MTCEHPDFVFIDYDGDMTTRAAPDVPELVAVSHEVFYAPTREWRKTVEPEYYRKNGDLVRDLIDKSKAAEIIAAKDEEIERLKLRRTDEMNDFVLMGMARDEFKNRAEAAEAKLAQYEAQEPVAWRHPDAGWTDVSKAKVAVHCKHGTQPQPLYASPAPAADLKAENERLRDALINAFNNIVHYSEDNENTRKVISEINLALDSDSNA